MREREEARASSRAEILNVAGNNLDSLEELSSFERLQELTASNNQLDNLRELVQLLSIWPRLKRLDASRNPLCAKARYRERLIVASTTLGKHSPFEIGSRVPFVDMLDGKLINDNARQFLVNWKASREAQQTRERSRPDLNAGK